MPTINTLYRFCVIAILAVLSGVNLYADDRAVPEEHASWLDAVNAPYAWSLGFTGQSVVVGVVDDCVSMHPYFRSNIDASLAYNTGVIFNDEKYRQEYLSTLPIQSEHDTSPVWDRALVDLPNYDKPVESNNDYHGICVTGCISAYDSESNTYGSAYGATIVPIRVDFACQTFGAKISDDVSVSDQAFHDALTYRNDVIDIKNNSYGSSVGYVGVSNDLTLSSIADAKANNTILMFSSGNERDSRVNFDGKVSSKKVMTAHPYTITVAATGKDMTSDYTHFAPFSDYGSCVFITAPGVSIQTADREDYPAGNLFLYECTLHEESAYQGIVAGNTMLEFNGTSASCPVATGVVALALEAYRKTYPGQVCDVRFIKQLLARTSAKIDLEADKRAMAWTTNAAGLSFSPTYGFGQIDAKGLIDAILYPEETLGGKFDTVTPQTVATLNWETMEVTSNERLIYHSTMTIFDDYSGDSISMSTPSAPENNMLAAAEEYQSGSADYVTQDFLQRMNADSVLVYSQTKTITDETFLNSGIIKQDLEEVVVTLTVTSDVEEGFDAQYLEIILDHNGVESILAFAEKQSLPQDLDDLTWSFSSNAFWGEDPLGDWTLNVYDVKGNEHFTVSDVYSTFYMGELRNSHPDVPEPSTWALLVLGVVALYKRKRGRG